MIFHSNVTSMVTFAAKITTTVDNTLEHSSSIRYPRKRPHRSRNRRDLTYSLVPPFSTVCCYAISIIMTLWARRRQYHGSLFITRWISHHSPTTVCHAYITTMKGPISKTFASSTFLMKSPMIRRTKDVFHSIRSSINSNNNMGAIMNHTINRKRSSFIQQSSSFDDTDGMVIDSMDAEDNMEDTDYDTLSTTKQLLQNWKSHPALQPTIYQLPTILVPNDIVHSLLREKDNTKENPTSKISLTPFLATHMEELQGIHPRIKIVRDIIPNSPLSSSVSYSSTTPSKGNQEDVHNTVASTRILSYQWNSKGSSIVQDSSSDSIASSGGTKHFKLILLHPQRVLYGLTSNQNMIDVGATEDQNNHPLTLKQAFPGMDTSLLEYLDSLHIQPGPTVSLSIPYSQQSVHKILATILPPSALPAPTGFEQIGHVIHLNLKKKHLPYRFMIGEILLDRFQPIIQSIVNKVGEVSGPFRTYDMEVLAGKHDTMVQLIEDGIRLKFDLRNVYWCTRLSGERSYLLEEEFHPNQIIVDAFCGVGALCLQAAQKLNATVYANDLNPDAIQYFQDNVKNNGIKLMRPEYPFVRQSTDNDQIVQKKKQKKGSKKDNVMGGSTIIEGKDKRSRSIHITCSDAFDFLQNVGWMNPLPDHIVMNFPLDSIRFLGALRWWPSDVVHESLYHSSPLVHLYTFAHADDDDDLNILKDGLPPRDTMNVAIDLVADGLIPEGGALEKSRYRKSELDKMGCCVRAREVRDVAPGKVVVCVSLKVTYQLIRVMQGYFIIE